MCEASDPDEWTLVHYGPDLSDENDDVEIQQNFCWKLSEGGNNRNDLDCRNKICDSALLPVFHQTKNYSNTGDLMECDDSRGVQSDISLKIGIQAGF